MSEAEDGPGKVSNLTAVEAISARLAEVTRLAEKLDARLCEAGARTRPVPMSSSAMSSASSLFSLSSSTPATTASSSIQPTSATISSIPTSSSSATSSSTAQVQPKSTVTAVKGTAWSSTTSGMPTTAPLIDGAAGRVPSPLLESSLKKAVESETRMETCEQLSGDDRSGQESADDIVDKSCDDSLADDSNVECYVTATDCSITPTARSRSESFVTSPECEDLAAPATMTTTSDTWWNVEEPKFGTATATMSSCVVKQAVELPKISEAEKKETLIEISKPEICETSGEKKVEKVVSIERRADEKSGKIVKEVTETTTLRVSHDTRLGVASYKVISNVVQDHRENVDVKEIKDLERMVTPEGYKKTNGYHHEAELGPKSESYSRRDELSTKSDDVERVIKFTKVSETSEEQKSFAASAEATKDMTLSLKEYTRHHEDSGIEMSPTKREDSLEGQDFLERARKVSPIGGPSMNECCCSCNCGHEASCFDRYSAQQSFIKLTAVNDNRCRLPLSNAS